MNTIDYLFEDPPITNQTFALVSIVGPHMPQKCDTWALKIRGVANTLEDAKSMCQRLMKIDQNYDIYTVDVGKFFPLNVEPHDIQDIEYSNTELNQLIKSYLENRQTANDQWHARKNEMIQKAVEEGKNQQELLKKPEHPISVLNRIKTYEEKIKSLHAELESTNNDLRLAKEKFAGMSQEDKDSALNNVMEQGTESPQSIDQIRSQLITELKDENETEDKMENTLDKIKHLEKQQTEVTSVRNTVNQETSPYIYSKLTQELEEIDSRINKLKVTLQNTDLVNEYINTNYPNPQYQLL
jgi:chromosome segregation ATPase